MRALRIPLALLACLGFAGAAYVEAKPAPVKKLPAVLDRVPADALVFVVIHNAKGAAGKVDQFLKDTSLAQFLPDWFRDGMLAMLRKQLRLGKGFAPDRAVVAAVLNPAAFKLDIPKLILGQLKGEAPPAAAEILRKLPLVLWVPGSGVKEVFGAYNPVAAGGRMKFRLPFGEVFAVKRGGYVAISPNPDALKVVAATKKSITGVIPARQAAAIARAEVAIFTNVKAAGPLLRSVIAAAEMFTGAQRKQPETQRSDRGNSLEFGYAALLQGSLKEIEQATITMRFVKTGVVFDALVAYDPGSVSGKAYAAYKAPPGSLVGKLPNRSYMMAMGIRKIMVADDKRDRAQVEAGMANPVFAKMPEATRKELVKTLTDVVEQTGGFQLSMGGVAEDAQGTFHLAAVVECEDVGKLTPILPKACALGIAAFRYILPAGTADEEEIKKELAKVKVEHKKNVERVAGLQTDAILITHPALEDSDIFQHVWTIMMGEDDIRIRLAKSAKKVLTLSMGGGAESLAMAIKAARTGGKIEKEKGTIEALAHMPANRYQLLLYNVGNYFKMLRGMVKNMGARAPPFPAFECKTPIAFGVGTRGPMIHAAVYVPAGVVKDVAELVQAMSGQIEGIAEPDEPEEQPQPLPGGEEF